MYGPRYNRKSLVRTVAPTVRVVSLPEIKNFLRLEDDFIDDDALLTEMIRGAEDALERYTRRAFITQTWKLTMDGFTADEVNLPRLPIQSITSITTYATDNTATVFSSTAYTLDTQGRVYLNEGGVWPTSLRDRAAVAILYVAGYGSNAHDVPEPIRLAVKAYAATLYDSRGACDMPPEAKTLLAGFRVLDDLGMW